MLLMAVGCRASRPCSRQSQQGGRPNVISICTVGHFELLCLVKYGYESVEVILDSAVFRLFE